jgi:hypothetical protein
MNRWQIRFPVPVEPSRPRMVRVEWMRSKDDSFDVDVALFLASLEEPEARLLAEYPALEEAWMGRRAPKNRRRF